jgi:hypothetical protein
MYGNRFISSLFLSTSFYQLAALDYCLTMLLVTLLSFGESLTEQMRGLSGNVLFACSLVFGTDTVSFSSTVPSAFCLNREATNFLAFLSEASSPKLKKVLVTNLDPRFGSFGSIWKVEVSVGRGGRLRVWLIGFRPVVSSYF